MIYISGKITGTNDYLEKFEKVENELKANGFIVVNPAKVNDMLPKECAYEEYMYMSFSMLKLCDTIYMLNDWKQSDGAKREHLFAMQNNYKIIYQGGTNNED